MSRRRLVNVVMILVLTVPLVLFAVPAHAQGGRTYGIATLAMDNDFWVASNSELEAQIKARDPQAKIVHVNANYDPVQQVSQIEDLIQSKVDVIFLSATDPAALVDVVKKADKAGIPVFQWDNFSPMAPVKLAALSGNYAMGFQNAMYIARRLNGKGNVVAVNLPNNTTWWDRTLGMYDAFKLFPDIKLVDEWMYQPGSVGALTPKQAVESLLQKHPDVNAVWTAWDQAAIDSAELLMSKGKTDVFTTGIDGFEQTLDYIRKGTPVAATMGQSPRSMARTIVDYAFRYLQNKDTKIPQLVITPVYQFTKDRLPEPGLGPMGYDKPEYIREHLDIMQRSL